MTPGRRNNDNEHVISLARALAPGQHIFLFQVRIVALIEGWLMRGDIDILCIERDADGNLHLLIADMKSSTAVKVEHRLQVAFYHAMLSALFAEHTLHAPISLPPFFIGARHTLLRLPSAPKNRPPCRPRWMPLTPSLEWTMPILK